MKRAIAKIDRAIKRLYSLEHDHRAEDFLVRHPIDGARIGNSDLQGALYLQGDARDVSIGIYLNESVRDTLTHYPQWSHSRWSTDQFNAFAIATEEVSHFNYFLFHAPQGRQLSHLELELQGEIDKFLIAWFANPHADFDQMFETLFFRFGLAQGLRAEQRERYLEANRLAKRFIHRHGRSLLLDPRKRERAFRWLRRFYRLNVSEKLSTIGLVP